MTKVTMVLTPHQYQTLLESIDLAVLRQADVIHAIRDEMLAEGGKTIDSIKAVKVAEQTLGRISDLKATILNG